MGVIINGTRTSGLCSSASFVNLSMPSSGWKIGESVSTSTVPSFSAFFAEFFSSGKSQCWMTREPPSDEVPTCL